MLTPTEVGGLPSFELAGYSPAMLAAFSTRRRELFNRERATVEKLIPARVHVRMHSGRTIRFAHDDDDLRHIDHAWSSTVHRAQGITTHNVIAVLDSAGMMSDRAMLYVEMSRARDGFVLLPHTCGCEHGQSLPPWRPGSTRPASAG